MKTKKNFLYWVVLVILAGCGVPQSDYDKLKSENEKLKGELDKSKNSAERLIAEVDEKERAGLKDINNTGIWMVDYYTNDFGEKTKESLIRNSNFIKGTFSNSATENSELNVMFVLTPTEVFIRLYEYAGDNPIKSRSTIKYLVTVKDSKNTQYKFKAENSYDSMDFNKSDSKELNNILLQGGKVQFFIEEIDDARTKYRFTIDKADWYGNAYKKLLSK